MKGTLVCFTGIDGAGKTTLARMTATRLREDGIDAVYAYCRYYPFLMKPVLSLSKHLVTRGEDFYRDYSSYSQTKKRTSSKHPFLAGLYRRFLMLDYAAQVRSKVEVPLRNGKVVVCDRYLYDTIATDLAIDFSLTDEEIKQQLHHSMERFPRPDITFLVDVPAEVAVQRKNDIPSIEYVKDRQRVYSMMGREFEMISLDGRKTPEELLEAVCTKLGVSISG